jgi:hypothetical protein
VAEAIGYLNFAVRPEGVYFRSGGSIQFVPFAGGAVKAIGALDKPTTSLSVSPDGRFFLYTTAGAPISDLMLVENFR